MKTVPPRRTLTHLSARGAARMVDVSGKLATQREAVAEGHVVMQRATLAIVRKGDAKKGDVLGAARLAGIMAAKRTHELIPLCHPLPIESVRVDIRPEPPDRLRIHARAVVIARTGVEMEAITAAGIAAMTVYDMCKAVDRSMEITDVRLEEK